MVNLSEVNAVDVISETSGKWSDGIAVEGCILQEGNNTFGCSQVLLRHIVRGGKYWVGAQPWLRISFFISVERPRRPRPGHRNRSSMTSFLSDQSARMECHDVRKDAFK